MLSTKMCVACKTPKPLNEFNKNCSRKDGLQGRCRPCDQQRARENYAKGLYNKKIKEARAVRAQSEREWLWDYLTNNPCVDCGESDPVVLEFDHVRGKKFANVSSMMGGNYSRRRLEEEIAKCDVRCANCHRRKTSLSLGWFNGGTVL